MPEGTDWDLWAPITGRGWGKTRCLAESAHVLAGRNPGLAGGLAARTLIDVAQVVIGHPRSGLLATSHRENPCKLVSRIRHPVIEWANGAYAEFQSSEEPDKARGHEYAWTVCDEVGTWKTVRDFEGNTTFDNLVFSTRGSEQSPMIAATSPRPVASVRKLMADGEAGLNGTILTTGTMYDNPDLPEAYIRRIEERYKGTRLFRQEALGELLLDVADAILTQSKLDSLRVAEAPEMAEIIVGVDPALTSNKKSDKTGINVAGRGLACGHLFSLENASCRLSPNGWGHRVIDLVHKYEDSGLLGKRAPAVRVVAENNVGGQLINTVLNGIDPSIRVKGKPSRGKKHVRAEPILAYYEREEAHIVGEQRELEDQMTLVTPSGYEGDHSPDDMDAHVIGATELMPVHGQIDWAEMAAANAG